MSFKDFLKGKLKFIEFEFMGQRLHAKILSAGEKASLVDNSPTEQSSVTDSFGFAASAISLSLYDDNQVKIYATDKEVLRSMTDEDLQALFSKLSEVLGFNNIGDEVEDIKN